MTLSTRFAYAFAVLAAVLIIPSRWCTAASHNVSQHEDKRPLVVHEWGTFTCLQDEQGNAIGGINEDDEPVPRFVHRIANFLLLSPTAEIPVLYQGAPHCHPDVTMRLETPVIYFHPAAGAKLPILLDVEVAFHSGWLSEYYPDAKVEAPGVKGQMSFGPIRADTIGKLRWKNLQVGADGESPGTTSPVWLTPRAVQSAPVTSESGEHEHFLFYRGVGHVKSPLRVVRQTADRTLQMTAAFHAPPESETVPSIRKLWLVEIRGDKSCAFREVQVVGLPAGGRSRISAGVANTAEAFQNSDFRKENVAKLAAAMRSALVEDGLFPDEADALLKTWKLSYFESPGTRVFYLLPRSWTDQVLPLHVSREAKIVRTMVGRIELVTPQQRRLLRQIAAGPASNPARSGGGRPKPDDFRAYEQLGRFRNALLLDEQRRLPTPELQKFIRNYGLEGYRL